VLGLTLVVLVWMAGNRGRASDGRRLSLVLG
jgi:hypothetical protein